MQVPDPTCFDRHDTVSIDRRLTALERRVVRLGSLDAEWSLMARNRVARLLAGIEGPQPLADARLEPLRRYASLA